MNETLTKAKKIATWIGAILLVIVLIVPYVWFVLYLRKQGKTLQLIPEFKIISIHTDGQDDIGTFTSAVKKAKESLKQVQK